MRKIYLILASFFVYGSVCAESLSLTTPTSFDSSTKSDDASLILSAASVGINKCNKAGALCNQIEPDMHRPHNIPTTVPNRAGLISDTKLFFSHQVAFLGLLYVMPEGVSGWSEEQKNADHFADWSDNTTHPVWDEDKFLINYVGHPYFGGVYYVRAQERGFDRTSAFWYSALLSLSWEMGLEALAEPASIQDIFVTPTFGYFLGNYFMSIRQGIKSKHRFERSTTDEWVLFFTDPIGSINTLIRRYFGWTTHLEMRPLISQPVYRRTTLPDWELSQYQLYLNSHDSIGIELSIMW